MASQQALYEALPHVFASLMLLVAANAVASADTASNTLQANKPSSIHLTLSKQADTTIRLEAKSAPLEQVIDYLVAKQVGLLAHKEQKDKPAELWLLDSSVGSCQAVIIRSAAKPPIQVITNSKLAFPRTSCFRSILFKHSFT
jgi:hypothetical protein